MPPKPQVFKTPDGKEFNTKKEWREYMILNFYSFTRKVNEPEPLVKAPGSIDGQTFDIAECENSTLVVLDHTEQIQIDQTKNCKIFIGACASSIFIRNCNDCTFYTCCRQLRLREVVNCTFHIYSMAEVHIEYSSKLKFAPFNGGYPEHAEHLGKANLKVDHNLWYDVYDHNDPNKTRENWSLLPVEHYGEPWFPAGAVCEPAVPITAIGSVKRADADGNMQSFSVQDMMQTTRTASKTSDSPVAPPPPQNTPVVSQPIMDPETAHITETVSKFATSKAGDDFSVRSASRTTPTTTNDSNCCR